MNPSPLSPSLVRCLGAFLVLLLLQFHPPMARGQLASYGYPVSSPEWEILMTDWGYADLALDRRPGFEGREYLSGEWAAAVHYSGGQNPTNAVWFEPQWYYPDWVSDSNFGVQQSFFPTGTNNANGFPVYRSVITNSDLGVIMTYEMLDTTNGIPAGLTPKSAGGAGSNLLSSRYVFRQTYRINNISGGPLTNFKFYQFLHGLAMNLSLYDDRLYAGALSEYRYDNTQQGQPYSFDSRTGETVQHFDTIALHAKVMPAAYEVGYYGRKGVDNHIIGKPGVGVHWSVETNFLHNTDSFSPPETRWVSGALRFDLGTLAAGATFTQDVLLSVKSTEVVVYPPPHIVIQNSQVKGDRFLIDFQDTTANPLLAFILRKSTNVTLKPATAWEQVFIPYTNNVPQTGWKRFGAPFDPAVPRSFYLIQSIIQD